MMKFFIVLFPCFLFCQSKMTIQHIDSELENAKVLRMKGKFDEAIKKNTYIINSSKQINYCEGIALGIINISYLYYFNGDSKKSLEYVKLAEKQACAKKNIEIQIKIKRLYCYYNISIGLNNEAINELKEIALLSEKIQTDTLRANSISMAYGDIGAVYWGKKKSDSATYYFKKALIPLSSKKLTLSQKGFFIWICLGLAEVKALEKKTDSAAMYVKLAESFPKQLMGNNEFRIYKVKGNIDGQRKQYDSAITNYQKSLVLAKKSKKTEEVIGLYKLISDASRSLGDKENAQKYLELYTDTQDSLNVNKTSDIEDTVNEFVNRKQIKKDSQINVVSYSIYIVFFILIISSAIIFKKSRKEGRSLTIKENENKELNKKLNIAFEEIVELAKRDAPEFLTRFQEVYPDFFKKILEIESNLQNSELKFCAFIFLNFSSKEIACYTFVQVQSVQMRKNRLRKKLKIASDEDIYIWMKKLNQS